MQQGQQHLKGRPLRPGPRRLGPRPFGLHLMTALSVWLSLPIAWPKLKSGLNGSRPELQGLLQKLDALKNSSGPVFEPVLMQAGIGRTRQFMAGVRGYRQHQAHRSDWFDRSGPSGKVIWHEGTTCLRDYSPDAPDAPLILVIPSLINRYDILDLDRSPSFLRSLAAHGLRPLVVDWDLPGSLEANFSLDDYVVKRLVPIVDFLRTLNGESVTILGYCMGGLLALALATLRPKASRALVLMATPWDFHRPDPAIGSAYQALADQMEPCFKALLHMPVDVIQGLFATFQPLQVLAKFTGFAALDPASAEARQFVLLEDWLNDGVPLTANVARTCLRDWYGANLPARNEWKVGGEIIDPRKLSMPAYVVVPGMDRIVPPESALPLAHLLPHAALHKPMIGHVGMMASTRAAQQVWAPLQHWLKEHA